MHATSMRTTALALLAAATFALTGCASSTEPAEAPEDAEESAPAVEVETDTVEPRLGTALTSSGIICPGGYYPRCFLALCGCY